MVEFFDSYWEVILGVSANLLIILKMLGTLKAKVLEVNNDSKKIFSKLMGEIVELKNDGAKKDKVLNLMLRYLADEADTKDLSQIIPQQLKDDYKEIKEEALKLRSEV